MKIIVLLGSEAEDYVREQSKLAHLADHAKAVARKAVKLADDLKVLTRKEGD